MDVAFRRAVADARRQGGLPFACLLSEDRIERAFGSARELWQGWVYCPAVTVWVFLSQCLRDSPEIRLGKTGEIGRKKAQKAQKKNIPKRSVSWSWMLRHFIFCVFCAFLRPT